MADSAEHSNNDAVAEEQAESEASNQPSTPSRHIALTPPKIAQSDTDDWITTFADIATLLLIFFIIMYAMVNLSVDQLEKVSDALKQQGFSSSTAQEDPFEELVQELEVSLGASGYDQFLHVQTKPGKVEIEMASASFFAGGGARFKREAIPILTHVAERIKPLTESGEMYVIVEGHTDDVPIKTAKYPSNWELSTARASNVVRFLIAKGVPPESLKAVGYAETRPKLANRDATGKAIVTNQALNRRVVITVTQ